MGITGPSGSTPQIQVKFFLYKLNGLLACFILLVVAFSSMPLLGAKSWEGFGFGRPYFQRLEFGADDPGSLCWSVVWDEEGVAYIGRDRLWRWDGTHWTVHGPDHLRLLRALELDPEGRLWMGGAHSLGYFNPGTLEYHSILSWFPEDHPPIGEVWNLHYDGEFLWVGTERKLYRLNEDTFHSWEFPGNHRVIFHFLQSGVYAHESGTGLWKINGEGVELYSDDANLVQPSLLLLEDSLSDSLIAVSSKGMFKAGDVSCEVINSFSEIQSRAFSCVHRIDETEIAIGTIGAGLFIVNNEGDLIISFNREGQFLGKLILDIEVDRNGVMWILESEGIWLFDPNVLATTVYNDSSLPLGKIRGVFQGNEEVYFAAQAGVAVLPRNFQGEIQQPNFITKKESGEIKVYDDLLVTNGYNELLILSDGRPVQVQEFGSEICSFAMDGGGVLHVGFSDRISSYRRGRDGSLDQLGEVLTDNVIYNLETDGSGRTWGWSHQTPLYEISYREGSEDRVGLHRSILGKSLREEDCKISMSSAGPVLMFEDSLIRLDPESKEWVLGKHRIGLGLPLAQAYRSNQGRLDGWLVYRDPETQCNLVLRLRWPADGPVEWEIMPWLDMADIGVIHKLQWTDVPGEELVFIGMNGLFMTDQDLSRHIPPPSKPVLWDGSGGARVAEALTLEYGEPVGRYTFSSPGADYYYPVRYQTRITGLTNNWSKPTRYTDREVGQLLEGNYRFEVRTVDPFGRVSPASSFSLKILPPWYRTVWAYGLAIGTVIMAAWGAVRIRVSQIRNRQLELESLVVERTEELTRANAFKDEFIANLSHEIRNPLNGVIGLIRQLKEGESPARRNIESLRGAAHYLEATVEDVLDFSKLESGDPSVVEKSFDPVRMASGVVGIYDEQARTKGLVLERRIDIPQDQWVCSDERKLQQILGNLLGNAVKFTAKGKIAVHIALKRTGDVNGQLLIRVTDTGPGIEPGEQQRIFDKFYQSKSGARRAGGTGLGLTLVKAFTECLDGDLMLESTPGIGSTFLVQIPVGLTQAGEEISSRVDEEVFALSVLIVEDLEYNRIHLEEYLIKHGCQVESAVDGDTGYAMASNGNHDVILLDWDLPGMTGLEIARRLRSEGCLPTRTTIIGMTAFATEEIRTQCMEAGMDAFLTKPLDARQLSDILKGVVPETRKDEVASSRPVDPDRLIVSRGILGEMASSGDWLEKKERWRGIFEEHYAALEAALEEGDTTRIRKEAHKFLGHLRMIKTETIGDCLLDMMTAAQAGDRVGARSEWPLLTELMVRFRKELDTL